MQNLINRQNKYDIIRYKYLSIWSGGSIYFYNTFGNELIVHHDGSIINYAMSIIQYGL